MNPTDSRKESLSAALDGEATSEELGHISAQWDHDEHCDNWHAWCVIGDVMRSEDMAAMPGCQRSFIEGFRAKLAEEPVVMAPSTQRTVAPHGSLQDLRQSWQRWGLQAGAMAAGLAVVGGAWMMLAGGAGRGPSGAIVATAVPIGPQASSSAVLRDPNLDQYLAAHRQYAVGGAIAAPGGVRQVAAQPAVGGGR